MPNTPTQSKTYSSPERKRPAARAQHKTFRKENKHFIDANRDLFDQNLTSILESELKNESKKIAIGREMLKLTGNSGGNEIIRNAISNPRSPHKPKLRELLPKDMSGASEIREYFRGAFITSIQKIARGYVTRKQIAEAKAAEAIAKENAKATIIQKIVRGFATRKQIAKENTKATSIQKIVRGFVTRNKIANEKSGTTLSKTAIALISLSLVAVGAAVASYLTIPAAAVAINLAASWMLVNVLAKASAFFMSKTGIIALAVIATTALGLVAASVVAQQTPSTGPSAAETPVLSSYEVKGLTRTAAAHSTGEKQKNAAQAARQPNSL
jgi:hypothetical protein